MVTTAENKDPGMACCKVLYWLQSSSILYTADIPKTTSQQHMMQMIHPLDMQKGSTNQAVQAMFECDMDMPAT